MRSLFSLAFIAVTFSLIIAACTKDSSSGSNPPVDPSTVCNATIYGYNAANADTVGGPFTRRPYGTINLGSVSINMADSIKLPAYNNQGAYNSNNNCYYTFTDSFGIAELVKIDASGTVTILPMANAQLSRFEALVYNSYSNKLYALKKGTSFIDTFVQVVEGSSDFTCNNITTIAQGAANMASSTVDQSSGTLFLAMNYALPSWNSKLYAYTPGNTSLDLKASYSDYLLGIRQNKKDKLLYTVKALSVTGGFYLQRLNPTGTLNYSDTLIASIDLHNYSTCMDVCDNKYIISTTKLVSPGVWSGNQCAVYQISTSGGSNQYNEVNDIFMGLDVKY